MAQDNKALYFFISCLRALNYQYIFTVHELRYEQYIFKGEKTENFQELSWKFPENFRKFTCPNRLKFPENFRKFTGPNRLKFSCPVRTIGHANFPIIFLQCRSIFVFSNIFCIGLLAFGIPANKTLILYKIFNLSAKASVKIDFILIFIPILCTYLPFNSAIQGSGARV